MLFIHFFLLFNIRNALSDSLEFKPNLFSQSSHQFQQNFKFFSLSKYKLSFLFQYRFSIHFSALFTAITLYYYFYSYNRLVSQRMCRTDVEKQLEFEKNFFFLIFFFAYIYVSVIKTTFPPFLTAIFPAFI
jgi:hypothetical protein